MKRPLRLLLAAPAAVLALSSSACELLLMPDFAQTDLSFSDRDSAQSRWMHGWDSGELAGLDGQVAGRFDSLRWNTPRSATPEGSVDGRVLQFELVAGAPGEDWGMTLVSLWLPQRANLKAGDVVTLPPADVRILACAGPSPGDWINEGHAKRTGATIRVDAVDPNILHVDFESGYSTDARLDGSATVRVPGGALSRF
jgi:hypothetical protein